MFRYTILLVGAENTKYYETLNFINYIVHISFNFLKTAFDKHGYILVRNLFTPDEVAKLKRYMEESREMQSKSYGRSDGKGRRTKVTLWNRAVDDVAGVVARLALMTKNKRFALERVG